MSMKYIRKAYGVPAKRGGQIVFRDYTGVEHDGVIMGSSGMYLRARLPTLDRSTTLLHPTSDVRYLTRKQDGF